MENKWSGPGPCPAGPALPALPAGPGRRGCLPFCRKKVAYIPPTKNSRHFFKKPTPPSLYLTPHILRTVAHLASPLLIFNTALTHV